MEHEIQVEDMLMTITMQGLAFAAILAAAAEKKTLMLGLM